MVFSLHVIVQGSSACQVADSDSMAMAVHGSGDSGHEHVPHGSGGTGSGRQLVRAASYESGDRMWGEDYSHVSERWQGVVMLNKVCKIYCVTESIWIPFAVATTDGLVWLCEKSPFNIRGDAASIESRKDSVEAESVVEGEALDNMIYLDDLTNFLDYMAKLKTSRDEANAIKLMGLYGTAVGSLSLITTPTATKYGRWEKLLEQRVTVLRQQPSFAPKLAAIILAASATGARGDSLDHTENESVWTVSYILKLIVFICGIWQIFSWFWRFSACGNTPKNKKAISREKLIEPGMHEREHESHVKDMIYITEKGYAFHTSADCERLSRAVTPVSSRSLCKTCAARDVVPSSTTITIR